MSKPITNYDVTKLPASTGRLIRFMAGPYRWGLFWFFTLTLLGTLAWTASPVVVAAIISHLGEGNQLDTWVWWMAGLYALLRAVDEIFWRVAELVMRSFKPQMIERVRSALFAATLRRSYGYSVSSSSGQVGYWVNQTRNTLNELVDTTVWTVWGRLIALIISGAFLYAVHWTLGTIFIVWLVLLFWYTAYRGKRFGDLIALQSEEDSRASGIVVDTLSNHLSVRIYNAQEREKHRLVEQQSKIVQRWRTSWMQNIITNIVKGQSAAIVSTVALVLALVLYAQGTIPLGGVVLFIAYFGDASGSLWQLAWAIDSYYRNFGTIQNALDGLNGEPARTGRPVARALIPRQVTLRFQDVAFTYPDNPQEAVLSGINLTVPAGQKIGVVGHSGAGKSTLVSLLLDFYAPSAGSIFINDTDIAAKDPSFVRAVSSFVPQDTTLFNRTIRENVMYARPEATETELLHALEQAEASEFVLKLPHGPDTLVGERGVKLSGGQRQRLAIARAILKDTPLLLLDEATSALDSVSEQSIQKALHRLMQGRTAVVIAHRLSTLKHLDQIVVLDQGRIAEAGPHEALVAKGGIYADLWKRQKDGFIVD